MEIDERENDLDLLQELKRSRLRLKYNWENLFKKYENVTESGIEVRLDTFEVYAPVGMDRKVVVKEVEKHEFLGSQFGASVFSAPGNEDSLEGCHPKIVEKCRKMDKEFSKIHSLMAVVPHRQKLKRGPSRGRKFFVRKTVREDMITMKPLSFQGLPSIAIDAGMSDGPINPQALKAIEGVPKAENQNQLAVVCSRNNQVPNVSFSSFVLDNGLSDGPIVTQPDSESEAKSNTRSDREPETAPDNELDTALDNALDTAPDSEPDIAPDTAPNAELDTAPDNESDTAENTDDIRVPAVQPVMINNGLSDGPVNLSTIYKVSNEPSSSQESQTSSYESLDFEIICENLKVKSESPLSDVRTRTAVKRFSSESIEHEVDVKKVKKEEETQSVDGIVLDLSLDKNKLQEMCSSEDNLWNESTCGSIANIVMEECKAHALFGVPLSDIDYNESLLMNWARSSREGIEHCCDGQDYAAREERRLMSSARRRNSFLSRVRLMTHGKTM